MPDTDLGQDPVSYGDAVHPVRQDPWEYIVEVHWGGGNIVIAEVPQRLCFLAAIDPPDPDVAHLLSGTYVTGAPVPESDYDITLAVTADIVVSSTLLKNLSNNTVPGIATLDDAETYPISGNGIPGPTFTYDRGGIGPFGGGSLSANASQTITADPVSIIMNYYFRVLTSDGHITDYSTVIDSMLGGPVTYRVLVDVFAYQVIGSMSTSPPFPSDASTLPGIEESYNMFYAPDFGPYDMQDFIVATFYSTTGPHDEFGIDPMTHNGQIIHGDTPGFPANYFGGGADSARRAWLTQVKFLFVETNTTYIVDFGRVADVAIMQKPLASSAFILPGYLPNHGTFLRAYESGVDLVVGNDHRVHALDPNTGLPAPEIWTALVPPNDPAPESDTQLAHFDGDGLL